MPERGLRGLIKEGSLKGEAALEISVRTRRKNSKDRKNEAGVAMLLIVEDLQNERVLFANGITYP